MLRAWILPVMCMSGFLERNKFVANSTCPPFVLTAHFPIWYRPNDGGRLDLFSPLMVSYSMSDPLLQTIPSLYPLTFESVMLYGGTAGLIVGGIMLVSTLRSELPSRRQKPIPMPRAKYHRS